MQYAQQPPYELPHVAALNLAAQDTAARAFYSYEVFESHDHDEHASHLDRWNQNYDQLTPGRFDGCLTNCCFGDLQIFRETTHQSLHETGSPWPGSRSFAIPLAMNGCGRVLNHSFSEDTAFTLAPKDELEFCTPRSLDIVGVSIEAKSLASFSKTIGVGDPDTTLAGVCLLPIAAERLHAVRLYLNGLFELLQANHDLLAYPAVQKVLGQAVMSVMMEFIADLDQTPTRRCALSYRRVVTAARDYVLTHTLEPVTIPDLCKTIGVSRRTLQTCFHEVMGVNPVQYLRAVRLNAVRRELRAGTPGLTFVQDVAARWGFWHLSGFSADYKKMFGELPSQTLTRN